MNIFEYATRMKFRFASAKGELTTEQLWDLPLVSKTGFDLDSVAKAANDDLQKAAETSFVKTNNSTRTATLQTRLDVVKHVIATKLAEAAAAQQAAADAALRGRAREILAKKEDAKLESMSEDDLRKLAGL